MTRSFSLDVVNRTLSAPAPISMVTPAEPLVLVPDITMLSAPLPAETLPPTTEPVKVSESAPVPPNRLSPEKTFRTKSLAPPWRLIESDPAPPLIVVALASAEREAKLIMSLASSPSM